MHGDFFRRRCLHLPVRNGLWATLTGIWHGMVTKKKHCTVHSAHNCMILSQA